MKWYQTVFIDGVDIVYEDINRKNSKFWNEGKWDNFIKPLLTDIDRGSFMEIGSNAGLFLKMAEDEDFKKITGIEASGRRVREAKLYKKSVGGNYSFFRQTVNSNFSLEQSHLQDVILLSNTHYYLPIADFMKLVDQMRSRSVYCIVVSCLARKLPGNAVSDIGSVRGYFRDWQEIKLVDGVDPQGDPSPRPYMYGVLFKGALKKKPIDKILMRWREGIKPVNGVVTDTLSPAFIEFYKKVLSGEKFDFKNTLYYKFLKKERPQYNTEEFMAKKRDLALDIQKNGLKNPIFFDRTDTLIDGLTRLFIMKELGHKNIFVRMM